MPISPEARFITRCVREPDTLLPRELQQCVRAVGDWQTVAELAARHGVSGYVRQAITRDRLDVPVFVADGLRTAALAQIAHVARLNVALGQLSEAFSAARVPFILLKGPVLSQLVYREPTLRPYSDLDLNVREPDEAAAVQAILSVGLGEVPHGAEVERQTHAHHVHGGTAFHRVFLGPRGTPSEGVMVELHLDPLQMGLRTTHEGLRWERAQPLPSQPGVQMLSLEDQIIQLSVHVHKHGFNRLIWLKDIDLLVRRYGATLDWDAVKADAQAEGVEGSVWYTLWLASTVFLAPVPPGVLQMLAPTAPVRLLYRQVWPPEGVANLEGHMRRRAVQFLAADSWRGMLPNLVLMGRRRTRARAILSAVFRR
ncbi:MAG: nucleotidyltransferase family protein [Chloroflexi bacterium]|nr:nucleotidyltransferase family protein [Chloroflexota bacterium]